MPNRAPTATLVVLTAGTPTQPARFDISASVDPEGRLKRWKLEFGDDTAFEGTALPTWPISHQYATTDSYDATLTVWDQSKRSDSMTVTVVVAADAPAPEPIPGPAPEPTPDPTPMPDPVPEPTPEPEPTPTPEPIPGPIPIPDPSPSGKHANYLAVCARPDLFKAYSLRPNPAITDKAHPDYGKQLLGKKLGGYAETDTGYDTIYDDARIWDAARLTIPQFANGASTHLAKPIGPDDTAVWFDVKFGDMKATRRFMVDDEQIECMTSVADATVLTMQVKRGVGGTVAAAHAAGAACRFNSNSAWNNIRLPLGTQDGHTYIFRIDTLHTDSYMQMNDPGLHTLTNHKWLNYISDGIWFEPDAQYSGGTVEANNSKGWTPTQPLGFNRSTDVAAFQIRSYNALGGKADFASNPVYAKGYAGPGVLNNDSLIPQLATFVIKPNRVVRHWMVIDQRANDYSRVSYAIADETTGIIWTHRDVPLTVRQSVKSVQELVLEFNTSTYAYSHNRALISYFGDMAAFKDPTGDLSDIYTLPSNAEWAR